MTQSVFNLDPAETLSRFDAAVDALEGHLARVLAEDGEKVAASELTAQQEQAKALQEQAKTLKEQVEALTEERDKLLADLEAERARVKSLKAANEDVSDRLEAVMGALQDMSPAVPG